MSMFGVRFVMPSGNVMAFADDKKSAEEFVDRLRLSPSLIREYAVKIVTLVGDEQGDK